MNHDPYMCRECDECDGTGEAPTIDTATGEQLDRMAAIIGVERQRQERVVIAIAPPGTLMPKPGMRVGVSVETFTKREGEPWVDEFNVPVKTRGIDTTPPTRAEAREVVADRLGISGRYVSDELADTEIERRSAVLEDWAGPRRLPTIYEIARADHEAMRKKTMGVAAAKADDEGYLFSRYGGRYPEGSRGGTIHFPLAGCGDQRRYTMNIPPGVDAEFHFEEGRWYWSAAWTHGMHGSALTLPAACDAVDEAIRKEMAEKPEREPGAMVCIGTCDMGERGRR